MTSYQFEVIAKNLTIKTIKELYDIDISINEIDFVWFAHELGYKKCTLYSPKMGRLYAEVTYNRDKDEMYLDIYSKDYNITFTSDKFDTTVSLENK